MCHQLRPPGIHAIHFHFHSFCYFIHHHFSAYSEHSVTVDRMSNSIHQPAPTPCLQLGHIITTSSSHHHDIFINIATQNVGGLKSESERGSRPKISTLRALARERLDFFVLTETRVDVRAVKKIKLKRNLQVTMHSLHPRPRGGGYRVLQKRT
jgi:hypothetical protein